MTKIRFTLSLFVAVSVMGLLSSCNSRKSDAAFSFYTDSIAYADSASVSDIDGAECSVTAFYPNGSDSVLVGSIRRWMAACLDVDTAVVWPDGMQLITTAVKKRVAENMAEVRDIRADMVADPQRPIEYVNTWDFKVPYASDKVVSYDCTSYTYTAGAHGSTVFTGANFLPGDGRIVGWDMFRESSFDGLLDLVLDGIAAQYFNVPRTGLSDCLFDVDSVRLPASAPVFTPEGMKFVYQQYEIAPYAAGMPSCTVPYDSLRGMLTSQSALLLP